MMMAGVVGCATAPYRSGLGDSSSKAEFERVFGGGEQGRTGDKARTAYEISTIWRRSSADPRKVLRRYVVSSFQMSGADAPRDKRFEFAFAATAEGQRLEIWPAIRLSPLGYDRIAVERWAQEAISSIAAAIKKTRIAAPAGLTVRIFLTDAERVVDHAYFVEGDTVLTFVARKDDLYSPEEPAALKSRFVGSLAHEIYHALFMADPASAQLFERRMRIADQQRAIGDPEFMKSELISLGVEGDREAALNEAAAEIFSQCALLHFSGVERRPAGPIFARSAEEITAVISEERRSRVRAFFDGTDPEAGKDGRNLISGYLLGQQIWMKRIGMRKDFRAGEPGSERVEDLCESGVLATPISLEPLALQALE